jgi:hypothetical protein
LPSWTPRAFAAASAAFRALRNRRALVFRKRGQHVK